MIKIPPRARFDLPEILEIVAELEIGGKGLLSHLQEGNLAAVCFPYRKEINRKISITSEQWQKTYSAPYEFSVYDGWIGDVDIAQTGTSVPLHLLPNEVAELKGATHPDGKTVIIAAVVHIERDELIRFIKWYKTESQDIAAQIESTPKLSGAEIEPSPSDKAKANEITDDEFPRGRTTTIRKRQTDKLEKTSQKIRYQLVLAKAKHVYPQPDKRPSAEVMAKKITGGPGKTFERLGFQTISKLIEGTYEPAKKLGLRGLTSLDD